MHSAVFVSLHVYAIKRRLNSDVTVLFQIFGGNFLFCFANLYLNLQSICIFHEDWTLEWLGFLVSSHCPDC